MNARKLAEAHSMIARGHELAAEALQEEAAPEAEPSKPSRKSRTRPLVGPLRPVTDDVAVARASRMRRGWGS